jgi:chromosome segregation ATPase
MEDSKPKQKIPEIDLDVVLHGWESQPNDKPKLSPVEFMKMTQKMLSVTIDFNVFGIHSVPYFKLFTETEMTEFLKYYYETYVLDVINVSITYKYVYNMLATNNLLSLEQAQTILECMKTKFPISTEGASKEKIESYIAIREKIISQYKAKYMELETQFKETEAKLQQEIANLKEQTDTVIVDDESEKLKDLETKLRLANENRLELVEALEKAKEEHREKEDLAAKKFHVMEMTYTGQIEKIEDKLAVANAELNKLKAYTSHREQQTNIYLTEIAQYKQTVVDKDDQIQTIIKEHTCQIDELIQLRNDHQLQTEELQKIKQELESKDNQIKELEKYKQKLVEIQANFSLIKL